MCRRTAAAGLLILMTVMSLQAQFFYFGRNKVQYTEFDWQVLRTEHFDIYYYPEMKDLAHQGASFAEKSYRELESRFAHTVMRRIPLIFYSSHLHFQQTNTTPGFIPEGVGGFFEFMKGRVVIPSDGSLDRFQHVITHELVHVFMHSKISRVLADHRLAQDRMPPLWFTEGLAEFWSTRWDDQAEMVMRDAVLNNYVVPLTEMDRIYGSFLMYKEGQNLLTFIEQRYGEEKIVLLMENFWRYSSFSEVMRFTLGKEYDEISEEWMYSLKKLYYPVLKTSDYAGSITATLVKTGFNNKPVFFRNGEKREVYFVGNHTGYTSIYKTDLDSKEKEREISVVIAGEKSSELEAFHVFQSRLSVQANGILAFVTKRGETDALHLYDLKEKQFVASLQFRELVTIASPSWSPDGNAIVFSSIDKSGMMDLYIYRRSTESLTRLTYDSYDDRDPVWSPDGSTIIFSSDRNSTGKGTVYNLFSYHSTTGKIRYVTYGTENYYAPIFSPNEKYLVFTSNADGAQNVWAMKTEELGRDSIQPSMCKVTSFSNAVFDPAWTDGDELVFSGFENYSFRLFSLSNVSTIIETSSTIHTFDPQYRGSVWMPQSLAGDTTIRSMDYEGEYSLDIAQSQVTTDPVFGTGGGAAVALSDVLGNDQYYFLLYNNAQTSGEFLESFNVAISRISLGQRTNYATGIFHFSGRRYDLTDPDLFYYERSFGGYYVLSYPLSKFQRLEAAVSLSNSDKEIIYGFRPRKALLVANTLSFVHDNSLWGPSGPLDGSRFLTTVAYTTDIQYSNVSYYTLMADYRHYFRLSQRSAYATRVMALYNEGREARRFFMGGSWDLRGYPRWSIRGKKMWFTSHELRFPFIDQLGVRFPFGGLGLGSIRGALFVDAGNAWDQKYVRTLGSIGTGIRINVFGVLVLRYDIGKRVEENFTKLQKSLFYQFFFGWDF